MGNHVINGKGGEAALTERLFLSTFMAYDWTANGHTPQNETIYVRWLDRATGVAKDGTVNDATRLVELIKMFSGDDDSISKLVQDIFDVPLVKASKVDATLENTIRNAYKNNLDKAALPSEFTEEEMDKDHSEGFQGDPAAGTAIVSAQPNFGLPDDYFNPDSLSPINIANWIQTGGMRGGGCAATFIPLEAELCIQKGYSVERTSLIGALPYSRHGDLDTPPESEVQLKSDYAFNGSAAFLEGFGSDQLQRYFGKCYMVSAPLSDGQIVRPETAIYNPDIQDTALIATNAVIGGCYYRVIMNMDPQTSFNTQQGYKVYVPLIGMKPSANDSYTIINDERNINVYESAVCYDKRRMRALCWFAAALKHLIHCKVMSGLFKKKEITLWESLTGNLKNDQTALNKAQEILNLCNKAIATFAEMDQGYRGVANQMMCLRFMPRDFFQRYTAHHPGTHDWWNQLYNVIPKQPLKSAAHNQSDLNDTVLENVISNAFSGKNVTVESALKKLFHSMLEAVDIWEYHTEAVASAQNVTQKPMLPLKNAVADTYFLLDTPNANDTILAAVNSQKAAGYQGKRGGKLGRLLDTEAILANHTDYPDHPVLVKYTSLLFTLILQNARDLNSLSVKQSVKLEESGNTKYFREWAKHLNSADEQHLWDVQFIADSQTLAHYSDKGYFLLPSLHPWSDKAWRELVGYQDSEQNPADRIPKTIDAVINDLTQLEKNVVYTVLTGLLHKDPSPQNYINSTHKEVYSEFEKVKGLLDDICTRLRQSKATLISNMAYDNIIVRFGELRTDYLDGMGFNPHHMFSNEICYYKANRESQKIYVTYPFKKELIQGEFFKRLKSCSIQLKVSTDHSNTPEEITMTLEYTRRPTNNQEVIAETRSFIYRKEENNIHILLGAPLLSMVPIFEGYDTRVTPKKPIAKFCYIWVSESADRQLFIDDRYDSSNEITIDGLTNNVGWKLCQKKQSQATGDIKDPVWSLYTDTEARWWPISYVKTVGNEQEKQGCGCFGIMPLLCEPNRQTPQIHIQNESADYKLTINLDFGTANSFMQVEKEIVGAAPQNTNQPFFKPKSSEVYLTYDLTDTDTMREMEGAANLHKWNVAPISDVTKGVPTMVQLYARPQNASECYSPMEEMDQYKTGHVLYPDVQTMDAIYNHLNALSNEIGKTISLHEIGFYDQLKIGRDHVFPDRAKEEGYAALRWFFMKSFLQNLIAGFYMDNNCKWPYDMDINCSYSVANLKAEYLTKISAFLDPHNQLPIDNSHFQQESICYICSNSTATAAGTTRILTVDIGAGTTDIAVCEQAGVNQWNIRRSASIPFAGEALIERSIYENLQIDKAATNDVFISGQLEGSETEKMTKIRSLITNGYLRPASQYKQPLALRMALRTVGLFLVIKKILPDGWNPQTVCISGGPANALQSLSLAGNIQCSLKDILAHVLGVPVTALAFDTAKSRIVEGLSKLAHGQVTTDTTKRDHTLKEEARTFWTHDDQPAANEINAFQYQTDSFINEIYAAMLRQPQFDPNQDKLYVNSNAQAALQTLLDHTRYAHNTKVQVSASRISAAPDFYFEMVEPQLGLYAMDLALYDEMNGSNVVFNSQYIV